MATLWNSESGWEYDVLRLLPRDEAKGVWKRALDQGTRRMVATWWAWPLIILVTLPIAFIVLIWNAAGGLGLGWFGRVLAEVGFHVFLAGLLHPVFKHVIPPLLRPFVRDELFLLVQQGLAPDHPLWQLKRRDGIGRDALGLS
jgi:hypothetical protein